MTRPWQISEDGDTRLPVSFRIYEGSGTAKSRPLVLYLPGHAFGSTPLRAADAPVALAMAEAGALVVEADCGSPSRNKFPESLERGFEALTYLFAKRKRFASLRSPVLVAGDEAGGNLAASLALKSRDAMPGELAAQVLLSPLLDPRMATISFRRAAEIGLAQRWSDGWSHYLGTACNGQHPYAAPCLCTRLVELAPALIMTADDDPLRDETLSYTERMRLAGVPVRARVLPAGLGWTGIYDGKQGEWSSRFSTEFAQFLNELPA